MNIPVDYNFYNLINYRFWFDNDLCLTSRPGTRSTSRERTTAKHSFNGETSLADCSDWPGLSSVLRLQTDKQNIISTAVNICESRRPVSRVDFVLWRPDMRLAKMKYGLQPPPPSSWSEICWQLFTSFIYWCLWQGGGRVSASNK